MTDTEKLARALEIIAEHEDVDLSGIWLMDDDRTQVLCGEGDDVGEVESDLVIRLVREGVIEPAIWLRCPGPHPQDWYMPPGAPAGDCLWCSGERVE